MKGGFVIYNDWLPLIEMLPMEERGEVLTALLRFSAKGEKTTTGKLASDMLLTMAYNTMQKDLDKYEERCKKNIESANIRWQKNANASERMQSHANASERIQENSEKCKRINSHCDNEYDNDYDNDTEHDYDKIKDKEKTNVNVSKKESEKVGVAAEAATSARKEKFYASLVPFVDKYGKDMIRDFFDYWSEMNRSKTKMRYEQQATWELALRLKTWADREKIPKKEGNPKVGMILTDNSIEKFKNQKLW